MKTCKYGCGGKMKDGGKVAAIKKMAAGGAMSPPRKCPVGKCFRGGKCIKCESSLSSIPSYNPEPANPYENQSNNTTFDNMVEKRKEARKKLEPKKIGGSIKKMAKGGSAGCPIGQCPKYVGGKRDGCGPCKPGTIAGVVGSAVGSLAVAGKMISDSIKKGKAVTAIKKANPGMTRKEARKKLNEPTEEKKLGGVKKKYAMGGSTIVGMPKYGNNPRVQPFKKGGSSKAAKFAALAPPYNKATAADRIAGATKKMKRGGSKK